MTVERLSAWIPVTAETLEDAHVWDELIEDFIRRAELAGRGFLGLVRCARCHRSVRCAYAIGDRLFGRVCFVRQWGPM